MSDNKFHDHLDVCDQCKSHPFGLCPVGEQALLDEVARMPPMPFTQQPITGFSRIKNPR